MSADILRRAAERLRERAEAATPGVWKLWGMSVMADQDGTSNVDTAVDVAHTLYRDEQGKPRTCDADYIATMHPGVGLALADWLSFVEQRHGPAFLDRDEEPSCNYVGCYENAEEYPCEDAQAAIAVARLILGEATS